MPRGGMGSRTEAFCVVLNPVRAGMVELPSDWRWSSYPNMLSQRSPPDWLTRDGLLAQFATERAEAVRRYVKSIAEGIGKETIRGDLNRQIYLGGEVFVERMQAKREGLSKTRDVPRA